MLDRRWRCGTVSVRHACRANGSLSKKVWESRWTVAPTCERGRSPRHTKEHIMKNTSTRRRITAATLALGAGAAALGMLAAPAAQAAPMTFAQACTTTHGWVATVVTAGIEECHWQDPNTGNEWIKKSPIGAPAT